MLALRAEMYLVYLPSTNNPDRLSVSSPRTRDAREKSSFRGVKTNKRAETVAIPKRSRFLIRPRLLHLLRLERCAHLRCSSCGKTANPRLRVLPGFDRIRWRRRLSPHREKGFTEEEQTHSPRFSGSSEFRARTRSKAFQSTNRTIVPIDFSVCPYRGLLHFREEDAPFFFGREAAIDKLADAVQQQ